jgi:dihydropyrimidinase/allantoinase
MMLIGLALTIVPALVLQRPDITPDWMEPNGFLIGVTGLFSILYRTCSTCACCLEENKGDELWPALPGFGGTALLYPILISEGMHKRGLSPARVAELASGNPARAYGLDGRKGNLLVGYDADLTVVDPDLEQEVTGELLLSGQDHCPFEGHKVRGWPVATVLRGQIAYANGTVTGTPRGTFVAR